MATVTSTSETTTTADPATVLAALADYQEVRPAILGDRFTGYAVQSGGVGAGTVVGWQLHATEKRVRDVLADVTTTDASVTETDRNSSLVTTYAVSPAGSGSQVVVTTSWDGAGGIGGFFERTFAPKGLARIYDGVLERLKARVEG
jgi:hypothetical protein